MNPKYEEFLKTHPEPAEIFKLAALLTEEELPYWFSVDDDFCEDWLSGDVGVEAELLDYQYLIEVQTGELIGDFAPISVAFICGEEHETDLLLFDMRPARGLECPTEKDGVIRSGLTAEQAMEILRNFFHSIE